MKIYRTVFQIKPEHQANFLEAMTDIASLCTANEPGCVRFDVFQDNSDPNSITVDEVFRDDDAVKAHAQSPHIATWRDKYPGMREWYAQDSVRSRLTNIFPSDAD